MAEMKLAATRMIWLDCLRLTAGLSMVVLHTTADANGQPWVAFPESERIGPIVLRTIAYSARTELFLLIASFLLIMSLHKRPRGYRDTIQEQSKRLLLPFIFWTVFYGCFNLIKAKQFGYFDAALADLTLPTLWVGHLLLGDIKFHMHFLPTLFGLVLFYPLFRISHKFPVAGLVVLPLLLIKWEFDRQVWSLFWGTDILPYLVRLVKVSTYVGYGMAAASLVALWQRTTADQRRIWLGPILFLALFLFGFKAVASYKTITESSWQYSYAAGYWADFLMPLVLFYVCMALSDRKWPAVLAKWGGYSFGIYLCHPIFVDLMEISLRDTTLGPMAQVSIKLAVALSATPLLVVLISKIPLMAWTVGLGPLPRIKFVPSFWRRSNAHVGHD